MKVTFYYSLFALIAIIFNFLMQELFLYIYIGKYALFGSVFLGTLSGLIIKFYLDKIFIFQYLTNSVKQDFTLLILYTFMGGMTTIIFWIFEFGFYHIFSTDLMKYIGGFFGLVIGYLTKYYLDKKFVFISKSDDKDVIK